MAKNLGVSPLSLLGSADPVQAVTAQLLMFCLKNGIQFSSLSIQQINTLLMEIIDIVVKEEARIAAETRQVPASAPPPSDPL